MTKKNNQISKEDGYKHILLSIFFFFVCNYGYAQISVKGRVCDVNNKPMVSAVVAVVKSSIVTTTNENGEFLLKLPEGEYTLCVTCLGCENSRTKIHVAKQISTINIVLKYTATTIDEVVVYRPVSDINLKGLIMGANNLQIYEIKRIPSLFGEIDIMRSLQSLPGVRATSEGSSGISVRGSSPGHNAILMDNMPIHNISHLMGFFSVFNNDVVREVELYKGFFPAKYGGRLASLLEVKTIDHQPKKLKLSGGLGIIASRLTLEAPLGDSTYCLLAGRRSYADLFMKLAPDKKTRDSRLYFYDLNGILSHHVSARDLVKLSAYHGKDKMIIEKMGLSYGNSTASLSWKHDYRSGLASDFMVGLSDYRYIVDSDWDFGRLKWLSNMRNYLARFDFNHPINTNNTLSYGVNVTLHQIAPCEIGGSYFFKYNVAKSNAVESSLYASNEQKIGDAVSLGYGVRFNAFKATGTKSKLYLAVEPRISTMFKFTPKGSLKLSYAHNNQFIQWASNSTSGSVLDVWFMANSMIKPSQIDIYSAGYFQNFGNNAYELSLEAYYKGMTDVIDFVENADLMMIDNIEDLVLTGSGYCYGVEFMVKKRLGKLTGFANYTYSHSELKIPGINAGLAYLSPYDKPHVVNLHLNYQSSKRWNFSVLWTYATGQPTNYPVGRFEIGGDYLPIFEGRNKSRFPDYHRLDLSATYVPQQKKQNGWYSDWNFSIYNAYGRKNPWTIDYSRESATLFYLFSIVPSVTYNFKF